MEDLEDRLINFTEKRNWKEVIKLGECYALTEKSRFSWAWPSEDCLTNLKQVLQRNSVGSILSIGCGSGLLEWILKESTGVPVGGIELGNSWWTSTYSPTTFIKLHFIAGDPNEQFLRNCAPTSNDFALLFCYFNNRTSFDKYIEGYTGKIVIIVGPKNDCGVVTDPLPLAPEFKESNGSDWVLDSVIGIGVDDCNVVATYRRNHLIKRC